MLSRVIFVLMTLVLFPEIRVLANSVHATTDPSNDTTKTILAMKHLLTSLFERYKRDMKSLKSVVMSSNAAVSQLESNYKDLSVRLQNMESKVNDILTSNNENVIDDSAIVERASDKLHNNIVSDDRISKLEDLSKTYAARTCYELKRMGITKSGRYYIDPDGHEMESGQPIEGRIIKVFYLNTKSLLVIKIISFIHLEIKVYN